MMKKSFKTCRTSNAPDYSEDDNICTDDMPKLADDEMAWDDKFETDNKKKRNKYFILEVITKQNGCVRSHHLNKSYWSTMI